MANITTQTIRVDLNTGKVIPVAYTHQNDSARTFIFDMYNGGLPYTMTGNTVKFAYKSPIVNGQYTVIAGASMESGTVSGNTVSVTLPAAYTAISGVGLLTMIITPTSGTIRPVNIKFIVKKSADGDDSIAGASDFPATLDEIAENWLDENISIQIDDTLSVSGKAADAKETGDKFNELDGQIGDLKSEISDLQEQIEGGGGGDGLTTAVKSALLQLADFVAYINANGQTYRDALYDAFYPPVEYTAIALDKNSLSFGSLNTTQQLTAVTTPIGGAVTWSSSNTSVATVSQTGLVTAVAYGNATITATCGNLTATCSITIAHATVTSISAVYTQRGTVYKRDSLDDLKSDIVVTANWSNGTSSTVASNDYTLSGTLTAGTSTITVSYSGKTTTFNVTVTADQFPSDTYQKVEWVGANLSNETAGPYISTDITESVKADIAGYSVDLTAVIETPIYNQDNNVAPVIGWGSVAAVYFGGTASNLIGFADATDAAFDSSISTGNKYDFHVYWDSEGGKATSGNNTCSRPFSSSALNNPVLKIGTGFYNMASSGSYQIYGNVLVRKNGNTVGNFYPCYRKSDGVIGFYDMVSEKFYSNEANGSFVKGSDI